MKEKNFRVIFDTNVWISFLIGKSLSIVKKFIFENKITIIVSQQLIDELTEVTGRKKIRKYFPNESVLELIDLLETIAEIFVVKPTHFICRDQKDNFLLDLIEFSKADYLVTGDKDLLELTPFQTATILTPNNFDKEMFSMFEINS
ncbi:MAG: putative toxin-antitoxin system toxin component, PIN family [Ignavibacteria bacterium]|nr:putative toxin-antitoxin system toxin component, PIN family [Ignavibacteria bacterium]